MKGNAGHYASQTDLVGFRFNKLTVIRFVYVRNNEAHWLCRCECGNETIIKRSSITNKRTKSCGCARKEAARRSHTIHGHCTKGQLSRTYHSYASMINRCTNPNDLGYQYYGAKGVMICERWLGENGFQNFLFDMGERPKGQSLDRINPCGNYEPSNCRWASQKEQSRNTRRTVFIEYNDERLPMTTFAEKYHIPYKTFWYLYRGKGKPINEIMKLYKSKELPPATGEGG